MSISEDDALALLITATCNIATNLPGGFAFGPAAFLQRVIDVSPDVEAQFWMRQEPLAVAALFREYPDIALQLKRKDVLAWVGDDDFVRVINSLWLNKKDDICQFVTSETQPGNRTCRFCTAIEPPGSLELEEFDGVHIHQRCRQYWNKWQRMAQKMEAAA